MFTLRRAALLAGVVAFAQPASAWYFETRFVERVGNVDVVLPGNTIDASDGSPRNIRIQVGVFDDASGPAPGGGVAGWLGQLTVSGAVNNSDERRTPGRLSPFTFANFPYSNGVPLLPDGDPFTMLTQIDAVAGPQSIPWACGPDGQPLPAPEPVIRGRNTFISTFAFTIDPNPGAINYSVTVTGTRNAYDRFVQNPFTVPPDCSDPDNPVPGTVVWSGLIVPTAPLTPVALNVVVPSPGAAAGLLAGSFAALCRRRHRARHSSV